MAYRISLIANRLKPAWLLVISCGLLVSLSGCVKIIEGVKGFTGISTKALEDTRKETLKKTFDYDYNTCFEKVREALGHMEAYIYAQDLKKSMIAIYVSEDDTTSVGIFFKAIDSTHTQIEVSSLSTYAKEFIAQKLFKALSPEKEKGKTDVSKDTEHK